MSSQKPKAVFTIIESEKLEKPIWRRIGSAFVNYRSGNCDRHHLPLRVERVLMAVAIRRVCT